MPDSYIQLPADGVGKKMSTHELNGEHVQYTMQRAKPTYNVLALDVAAGAGKHHLGIFNGAGSGKLLRLRKLFYIHTNITAVAGAPTRFEIKRTTAQSAGTTIPTTGSAVGAVTPSDSDDGNLPAQVLLGTGCTITEANILYALILTPEESLGTNPLDKATYLQNVNLVPESIEVREPILREGQGITVKQITSNVIGVYSWLAVITAE